MGSIDPEEALPFQTQPVKSSEGRSVEAGGTQLDRFRPFVPIQNISLFRALIKHASIHKYGPLCNTKISIFLFHCVRDIWCIRKNFICFTTEKMGEANSLQKCIGLKGEMGRSF